MSLSKRLALGAVALLVSSCGGGGPSKLPPRPSLLETGGESVGYRSPARWRYHPKKESPLLARFEIAKGKELYAGERGERWLIDKKNKRVEAAARLAPEQLISVLKTGDGGWLFVGASGTGYEARQPLGPFVRSSAPLDRLARVSAAGSTIVGVTKGGVLTRTKDAGGSWQAVGPKDARFVDVALGDKGQGLAIAVPERLFFTEDHGASWKPLETPTVGAFGLLSDGKSSIVVSSPLGDLAWRPGQTPALSPAGRAPQRSRYRLKLPPPRGPDAGALSSGRAIVLGDRYVELAELEGSSGTWQIWRGRLDGAISPKPFERAKGCRNVRLAGFDRWLYFACTGTAASATQSVEIFRSSDHGKTWKAEDYSIEAKLAELDLAVGTGGQLLVTGVCAAAAAGRGCSPYGVHYRRLAKDDDKDKKGKKKNGKEASKKSDKAKDKPKKKQRRWELALAATPSLKGSADELAFSPDGRTAFAVGKRTKNNAFAVFVSHDGGKSFEAREIDQIPPGSEVDTSGEEHWSYYYGKRPRNVGGKVLSARALDDGTFGIVFEREGSPVVVVTDDEGRILSLAGPPSEATSVGVAGSRGLAMSPRTRQVWETLDGGATWDPIGRLPLDLCPGDANCQTPIACHAGGCVVGHELSRVGWRGQADDDQGVLGSGADRTPDMFDRKIRTPIACALEEGSWRAIDGISEAPAADQAALGKVAWFSAVQDDERAAASVLHATGGTRPKVESVTLLSPSQRPAEHAMYVSTRVEGVAAMRYPTPEAGGGTNLKNVEISWDNLLEGKLVRARLADAGVYRAGDYARGSGRVQIAKPALMSIGEGGLYLRPHNSERDDQTTYFLDGSSVESVPAVKWPAAGQGSRTEMARIGGTHVPLMIVDGGAAILRARKSGSSWAFDAYATGLAQPRDFDLNQSWDIAYAKDRAGLHLLLFDPQSSQRVATLFPFRAAGAVVDTPLRVPTQLDTGDKPNRCGTAHKSDTPRVVAPHQGGTRHPIIVTDASEPMRVLMTDRAVMHGSPEEPCVAAFDAEIVPIDMSTGLGAAGAGSPGYGGLGGIGLGGAAAAPAVSEREEALLLLDDMEHSWLFRHTQSGGKARVEYRVMNCRFDAAVEVPPEVYDAQGTLVRRTR